MVLFGGFGQVALDDVHVCQIQSDGAHAEWSQPPVFGNSPGPRCAHAAVSTPDGTGVIIFGGYTSTHGADAALSLLEMLTPRAPSARELRWTPLYARAPPGCDVARSGHTAALVSDNRLLVVGGLAASDQAVLGDVLCLDVSEEGLERLRHPEGGAQWEALRLDHGESECAEEELARYNHACAVITDHQTGEELLLVVGGNGKDHEPLADGVALVVPGRAGR